MMKILRTKLRRDLLQMQGQATAIALVVACGVASFITMRAMYRSLLRSQTEYYAQYHFADVFTELKRAPLHEAVRIQAIPGVDQVEPRVAMDVTLDVPNLQEPAVGHIIGLPESARQHLNLLHMRTGKGLGGSPDDVIVSEAFASANTLRPGDSLQAVINGRWQRLNVVGIAISPEYIYEIRGGGSIFPDNKRFGVLWMSKEALSTALNMKGSFNSLSLTLQPQAQPQEVISHIDRILSRYGGLGAYGRNDQTSHRFISDEIAQNRITATIIPSIFLGVAALLVHLSFTRLVAMQRGQIGVLKAFGYSNWQVGWHFIQYSLFITGAGYIVGCSGGWFLGVRLANLYAQFYRFPLLVYRPEPSIFLWAGITTGITAVAGALSAVRRAIALAPAQAMMPEAPPEFRPRLLDRLHLARLSASIRMVLRNLERRPWRVLGSVCAISCAVMMIVVEFGLLDAMNRMMEIQFRDAQREDVAVSLVEARGQGALESFARLPGVLKSEPYRVVPIRMQSEHGFRRTVIFGYSPKGDLRLVVDQHGNRITIPPDGLLISNALASALHVSVGQSVSVEILEGRRLKRDLPITAIVDDLFGTFAYMALPRLNELLGEDSVISGAVLQVDASKREPLYRFLKRLPAISAVSIKEAAIVSFRETLRRSMLLSIGTLILFAGVIAVGMIYNGARVALSERSRELATLRILGFSRQEITSVLLGEQAVIVLTALPFGFAGGYGLCRLLAARLQTELYRLPVVVQRPSYAWASVIVFVASVASGILIGRRTASLDIISVLKAGE